MLNTLRKCGTVLNTIYMYVCLVVYFKCLQKTTIELQSFEFKSRPMPLHYMLILFWSWPQINEILFLTLNHAIHTSKHRREKYFSYLICIYGTQKKKKKQKSFYNENIYIPQAHIQYTYKCLLVSSINLVPKLKFFF